MTPAEQSLLHLCGLKKFKLNWEINWQDFWNLVSLNAVELQVLKQLRQVRPQTSIPDQVLSQAETDEAWNISRTKCFRSVLKELNKSGERICLLKGAALGPLLFGNSNYKRMNDIDILIRPEQFKALENILQNFGFQNFVKQKKEMPQHHTSPFFHLKSQCIIGIHFNISSKYKITAKDLWTETEAISYAGQPALILSKEYNLLHLCLHLPFIKTGLRELLDIALLIEKRGIAWPKFIAISKKAQAEERVYRTLSLIQKISPIETQVFETFRNKQRYFVKKDTEKRQDFLLYSRSTLLAKIELWFLVYRLSCSSLEKKTAIEKILTILFRQDSSEKVRLVGPSRGSASLKLFQALIYEHGFKKVSLTLFAICFHWPALAIKRKDAAKLSELSKSKLFSKLE